MISIREQSYGLNVALYNEFTLDDFRQLEEALLAAKQKIHLPDILLDLSMLKDFTIDMAVEQIKFLNQHENRLRPRCRHYRRHLDQTRRAPFQPPDQPTSQIF